QVKTWELPAGMSASGGETWTVAAGPLADGVPGATCSAVIPPTFEMVWETVNATPVCAAAGATALAVSEAGTPSTTWNTLGAVPLPYGPATESPEVPGGRAAGTVADS